MENKGPIIISYLSLIILIIILLQVSGALKALTILVLLITEALVFTALSQEEKWDFQSWFAFLTFMVTLLFVLAHLQSGVTNVTAPLSVELIVAAIVGFFITVFSPDTTEAESDVQIVELEPKVEIIHEKQKPAPKKTTPAKPKKELIVGVEGGDKYHLPGCRAIKQAPKEKIQVYTSKRQAAGHKLQACKICFK